MIAYFLTELRYMHIWFSRQFSVQHQQQSFLVLWQKELSSVLIAYIQQSSAWLFIRFQDTGFGAVAGLHSLASTISQVLQQFIWLAVLQHLLVQSSSDLVSVSMAKTASPEQFQVIAWHLVLWVYSFFGSAGSDLMVLQLFLWQVMTQSQMQVWFSIQLTFAQQFLHSQLCLLLGLSIRNLMFLWHWMVLLQDLLLLLLVVIQLSLGLLLLSV